MPNYDIYILPESQISFSPGAQLDGVTQGDGSHLVGETLTLTSGSWLAINITDNNTDFQDSQGSNQTITNTHTIDGVTFTAGTNVEAEYAIELTDGVNTYTAIAFNFSTGSPAFGTVEALAFIGPVAGFPPVGVELTVVSNFEGPSNASTSHASPPCFALDTLILTPTGQRSVQDISIGDLVETEADGPQPVRWVGQCTYPAQGRFAPIRFDAGVLGNAGALTLSPQHRLKVSGWQAEYLFGEPSVLVPAHCFVGQEGVRRINDGFVTYHHLMFDQHQIIFSEGIATESFFANATGGHPNANEAKDELLHFFPELDADALARRTAKMCVKPYEAHVMLKYPL